MASKNNESQAAEPLNDEYEGWYKDEGFKKCCFDASEQVSGSDILLLH